MKLSEILKESLRNHPELIWILANMVGWGLANFNYLSFIHISGISSFPVSPFLLTNVQSPVISGAILGIIQSIYLKKYAREVFALSWLIRTWISIILIFILNTLFLPGILFPWFVPIMSRVFSPIGFSVQYLSGVEIYSQNILVAIINTCIFGVLIGGISGFILGLMQSGQIADRRFAIRWFFVVAFSVCLGYVLCSLFATTISYLCSCSRLFKIAPFAAGLIGFIYGLGTSGTMKELVTTL